MKKCMKRVVVASMSILAGVLIANISVGAEGELPGPYDEVNNSSNWVEQDLKYVEENRDQIIADIISVFSAQTDDNGYELASVLINATAEQLLAAQNAGTLYEVNSILSGATAENVDMPLTVGDPEQDYTFTPVTPCRIVDTRNAIGAFVGTVERSYRVHGTTDIESQGGATGGCTSPVGEPRGVMINITAVPVSGNGNFIAYPSTDVSAPDPGSLVNYKTGVQNVANAASVKTGWNVGDDIKVTNRFGTAHLVIDVIGYYSDPTVPVGVDYSGGEQILYLSSTDQTARSLTVTTPTESGRYCVVTASGYFNNAALWSRCSITQDSTAIDFDYLIYSADTTYDAFGGTRGFYQSAGTTLTYRLICSAGSTSNSVRDSSLTAVCTNNRY